VKIGVYVDGYNLYYGGRRLCGKGQPGWRWLDVRALADSLIVKHGRWAGATIDRVVYCTARIGGTSDPGSIRDQATYIDALQTAGSIDVLAEGYYLEKTLIGPLAKKDAAGRPSVAKPQWPLVVQDPPGQPRPNAMILAQIAAREEKGSDVNVASHLLIDVLGGSVDGAIVVSNDSDLSFPVAHARTVVPVGVVNPSQQVTAGALRGTPADGVGGHWWRKLTAADLKTHQLPDPVGPFSKPAGW